MALVFPEPGELLQNSRTVFRSIAFLPYLCFFLVSFTWSSPLQTKSFVTLLTTSKNTCHASLLIMTCEYKCVANGCTLTVKQ